MTITGPAANHFKNQRSRLLFCFWGVVGGAGAKRREADLWWRRFGQHDSPLVENGSNAYLWTQKRQRSAHYDQYVGAGPRNHRLALKNPPTSCNRRAPPTGGGDPFIILHLCDVTVECKGRFKWVTQCVCHGCRDVGYPHSLYPFEVYFTTAPNNAGFWVDSRNRIKARTHAHAWNTHAHTRMQANTDTITRTCTKTLTATWLVLVWPLCGAGVLHCFSGPIKWPQSTWRKYPSTQLMSERAALVKREFMWLSFCINRSLVLCVPFLLLFNPMFSSHSVSRLSSLAPFHYCSVSLFFFPCEALCIAVKHRSTLYN